MAEADTLKRADRAARVAAGVRADSAMLPDSIARVDRVPIEDHTTTNADSMSVESRAAEYARCVAVAEGGEVPVNRGVAVNRATRTADPAPAARTVQADSVAGPDHLPHADSIRHPNGVPDADSVPDPDRILAELGECMNRPGADAALGRLMADAQRWASDADLAIVPVNDMRAGLAAGPVTRRELLRVLPSRRRLARLQMTGGQVRAALERGLRGMQPVVYVSGIKIWYDPAAPAGNRIVTLERATGEPIVGGRLYTVAVPEFPEGPADGFTAFGHALARTDTGIDPVDALADYLSGLQQPVRAPAEPRLLRLPAAAEGVKDDEG